MDLWLLLVGGSLGGCWLLAAHCWLLAAGCSLLAAGCWLLAGGWWLVAALDDCWLLAAHRVEAGSLCNEIERGENN